MHWGLKCQRKVWRQCGCDTEHNCLLGISHQSQTSSFYFFLSLHKDSITKRPRTNAKLYIYRNKHDSVIPKNERVSQCEFLMIRPPAEMKVTCSKTWNPFDQALHKILTHKIHLKLSRELWTSLHKPEYLL